MMSSSSHICPGDLVIITNFAPEYNPERVGMNVTSFLNLDQELRIDPPNRVPVGGENL